MGVKYSSTHTFVFFAFQLIQLSVLTHCVALFGFELLETLLVMVDDTIEAWN